MKTSWSVHCSLLVNMLVMDNKIITKVLIVYDVSMAAAALSSVYFPLSLPRASARPLATINDVLAVLVHLQLDNDHLAGVDTNIDCGTVSFLSLNPLDVDSELLPVTLDNLAHLLTLVVTSHHLNFIIFSEWHGSDSILGFQFLGERSRHQPSPDVGRGREVTLSALGAVRRNVFVEFHLLL